MEPLQVMATAQFPPYGTTAHYSSISFKNLSTKKWLVADPGWTQRRSILQQRWSWTMGESGEVEMEVAWLEVKLFSNTKPTFIIIIQCLHKLPKYLFDWLGWYLVSDIRYQNRVRVTLLELIQEISNFIEKTPHMILGGCCLVRKGKLSECTVKVRRSTSPRSA